MLAIAVPAAVANVAPKFWPGVGVVVARVSGGMLALSTGDELAWCAGLLLPTAALLAPPLAPPLIAPAALLLLLLPLTFIGLKLAADCGRLGAMPASDRPR